MHDASHAENSADPERIPRPVIERALARLLAPGTSAPAAGLSLAGRPAPEEEAVELVYFHAAPPARDPAAAEADLARLALAVQSAALRAPRSARVLITGVDTRIPEGIALHHVIRANIDPARVAYERLRLQHTLLAQRPRRTATVFLDAQAIANRPPASAFARGFDVGLTVDAGDDGIPVHAGVVYAAPGERAERYYRRALDAFDTLANDAGIAAGFAAPLRAVHGDGLALWAAAGTWRPEAGAPENNLRGFTLDGLRIALLPCAQYNFRMLRGVPYRSADMAHRYFIRFDRDSLAAQARYVEMIGRGLV